MPDKKTIEAVLILRTLEGDILELAGSQEVVSYFGELVSRVRRGEDPRLLGRAWKFTLDSPGTSFPSTEAAMRNTTLTVLRGEDQFITVELVFLYGSWYIAESLDENGNEIKLTSKECSDVLARALSGEDETGV